MGCLLILKNAMTPVPVCRSRKDTLEAPKVKIKEPSDGVRPWWREVK